MASKTLKNVLRGPLSQGKIGVLPTDTMYGIVGSALYKDTVEEIYRLRKRNKKKPMIVLIGDIRDLARFGVRLTPASRALLKKVWPGKVSVILPCASAKAKQFSYLHRGARTIAFRLPKPQWLRELLHATGPLVAPSANFEGERPSRTIREAKRYFGDSVSFYIDAGRLDSKPSTLVAIAPAISGKARFIVLREGAVRIRA